MLIEKGSTEDWRALAGFHYRSHRISAPRNIFCLKRGDEFCGVIVYCYPPSASFGRRLVLPRMSMRELNEKLSVISRLFLNQNELREYTLRQPKRDPSKKMLILVLSKLKRYVKPKKPKKSITMSGQYLTEKEYSELLG